MNLKLLMYLTASLLFLACDKDGSSHLQFGYPDGVKVTDMDSENDCSLEECSGDRVVRLIAKDVKGTIRNSSIEDNVYVLSYWVCEDCTIELYFCDLPIEFREDGLEVKFSGDLIDACGIREPFWPIVELYLLKLTKIEKI